MSKITNEGLTRAGTGCFIAVPIWQQWASIGWWIYVVVKAVWQPYLHSGLDVFKLVAWIQ